MTDISRGDIDRLYEGIEATRKDVAASEIRLGQRIDAQRLENDRKYVTSADLELVKKDVTTLTTVVNNELGKRTWNRQTIILAALAFASNLAIAIFNWVGLMVHK